MNLTRASRTAVLLAGVQTALGLVALFLPPGVLASYKPAGLARILAVTPVAASLALVFFFLSLSRSLPLPRLSRRMYTAAKLACAAACLSTPLSVLLRASLPLSFVLSATFSGLVLGPFLYAVCSNKPGPESKRPAMQGAALAATSLLSVQASLTFFWTFSGTALSLAALPKIDAAAVLLRLAAHIVPATIAALAGGLTALLIEHIRKAYDVHADEDLSPPARKS